MRCSRSRTSSPLSDSNDDRPVRRLTGPTTDRYDDEGPDREVRAFVRSVALAELGADPRRRRPHLADDVGATSLVEPEHRAGGADGRDDLAAGRDRRRDAPDALVDLFEALGPAR